LKKQLVIDSNTKRVICVAIGTGRRHDLGLLKTSKTRFAQTVVVKADKGYQGIKKVHGLSETPQKKPRGGQLTEEQRIQNRELARERIVVEHVNRRFKVFRVLSERYRNRRSRYGLRVNLVAGIYNLDCVDNP
jgi:IS5 family transposase